MTPAARVQAAIEVLDRIISGTPAEQALTGWARKSRFAGSGDRAAVRDHVFDAVRHMRSDAALGGAVTGRGLMLGALRRTGSNPDEIFSGVGHAPVPLSADERTSGRPPQSPAERLDIPDWLWPSFMRSLGDSAEAAAAALQSRAPVHLRVNTRATNRDSAIKALAADNVVCAPHPASPTALTVSDGARRIRQSAAYLAGLVELQDAASQAVTDALPLRDGMRVLDYCAGGGGKALAMAAHAGISVFAHDIAPDRMRDLPARAERAGVRVTVLTPEQVATVEPFDVVLCDAPCSGSGSWRRSPDGKWRLTEKRLEELVEIQAGILERAANLTSRNGVLAFATCSLLHDENSAQIGTFLKNRADWIEIMQQTWPVQRGTDGFFTAHLTRE